MSNKSFAALFFALSFIPAASRAQTPTPGRVSPPSKALEMKVDCGKEEMYYHLAGYSVEVHEKSTRANVPFPAPLEVKLEGVPLQLIGRSNIAGAGFFGEYYVPLSVPAGSRTLSVRSGAVDGSCTVNVKKAAAHLKVKPSQAEAMPGTLQNAGFAGQTYLIADAVLTRQQGYTSGFEPVSGQAVRFQVNGKEQPPVTTDAGGSARLKVKAAPGPTDVRATFEGNGQLLGATDSASIQIR